MPTAEALTFQDPVDAIIGLPVPAGLRRTSSLFALMLVALTLAAAVTQVDVVVSGPGVLAADHPTAVLQAMDRAVVRTLSVRAGDHVTRGEILATLDPTFAQADLRALQAQRRTMAAEIARLSAEQIGGDYAQGSADTEEARLQGAVFRQRRAAYQARLEGYARTLEHAQAELDTMRGQMTANTAIARVYGQIRSMRQNLLQGAVGSRLQYLDAQAAAERADAAINDAAGRINELGRAVQSVAADRQAFVEEWRRDVVETLAARRAALTQTDGALAKAERLQALVEVRAPEDGVVLSVASRAPGSVLGPDQPLLVLLPARAALTAELTVRSADVGYLRAGDAVEVQVDAFRSERHGVLHGHVRAVTEASEPGAAGGAVHRVNVTLDGKDLSNLPPGTGPMPGMTIVGDVRVGSRSVLAYFLAPITRGFAQSLREP